MDNMDIDDLKIAFTKHVGPKQLTINIFCQILIAGLKNVLWYVALLQFCAAKPTVLTKDDYCFIL